MCGQPQDSAHPVLVLIFQEDIPTTHSPPTTPYIGGSRPVKQEMRTSRGPPCAEKHVRYFPTESPRLCSQWPCEMGRFIAVLQWEYRAHCTSECQRRLRRQGWQSQDPVPLAALRPLDLLPGALKLLSRRVSTVCVQAVRGGPAWGLAASVWGLLSDVSGRSRHPGGWACEPSGCWQQWRASGWGWGSGLLPRQPQIWPLW